MSERLKIHWRSLCQPCVVHFFFFLVLCVCQLWFVWNNNHFLITFHLVSKYVVPSMKVWDVWPLPTKSNWIKFRMQSIRLDIFNFHNSLVYVWRLKFPKAINVLQLLHGINVHTTQVQINSSSGIASPQIPAHLTIILLYYLHLMSDIFYWSSL